MVKPEFKKVPFGNCCTYELLAEEFRQAVEEGRDVQSLEPLFVAAAKLENSEAKKKIADALYELVSEAEIKADFSYNEPYSFKEIQSLRKGASDYKKAPDSKTLSSKIHGAWLGRICGCMLGKTIEGIHTDELVPLLKETNNFPLRRYIRRADMSEEIYKKYKYPLKERWFIDEWDGMPADDDTNYLILAQNLIEHCGRDFTAYDVAGNWLHSQPKTAYWTAEQIAYCNFINGYVPPQSAVYQNPYREWIGAQIRGDYYGYINAGNPQEAAEMAFRDASVSHTKNGIYGEMFVSAMIAVAAVEEDISKIIECGLAQIPHTSRLYEAVQSILSDYRGGVPTQKVFEKIHAKFDEHVLHENLHVISNAMIVTASLLYGEGEYGKSICMAVETGFDTDCNGATVGSVLGMRGGVEGIEECWKQPIGDTLYTEILGANKVSIAKCVEKTLKHIGNRE